MVEFLTGSTLFSELLSNPPYLLVFVFITVPNYGLCAILFREALVAWRKGWASLLSLGIAYGAINEGLMAKTYFTFQPLSPALGSAAGVGRLFGIDWPWVTGITLFHMIASMSVPVALCFLIFPGVASQRLLGRRGTGTAIGLLALQVVTWTPILLVLDPGLHQDLPLLAFPVAIVLVFTYSARRLPVADPARRLSGFFGKPSTLVVSAVAFFLVTFAPILRFFAFPLIPISVLYQLVYRLDPTGAFAMFYPMLFAALAITFLARYSLSKKQVLALIGGAMLIPLISGSRLSTSQRGLPSGRSST